MNFKEPLAFWKKTMFLVLFSICCFNSIVGQTSLESTEQSEQEDSKRKYFTTFASSEIQIDGLISESVWNTVEWSGDFIQREPVDKGEPTSETAFKILYDNKFIYVGIRCFDGEPDEIVKRMSRRDGFDGDWVEINIDSYHDLRTAFSFTATVAGVKGDEFISQDGQNWDTNWNPIWNFKTNIDSLGWTVEMAIPLSQLRFDNAENQVWGLQFTRRDFRNNSRSNWQYNQQNSGYWVSAFGELHGIKKIEPKRQVEIQPYVLAQYDVSTEIEGHPFRTGRDANFTAGLDGKIGITNDLTLDFTVNPDFGQVEADPSALNLDGFEVFFSERRPFFVENRNIFNYNISNSNAGGGYDSDNLFYSRRIGAAPHRRLFETENVYIDQPDFTSILGAAKFSGKTNGGLTIGVLESVTAEERATVRQGQDDTEEVVEPLTNYAVVRALQDFNQGNTVIGVIGTSVNRRLNDDEILDIHKSAYSSGIDFLHQWKNKKWRLNASFVGSQVRGTSSVITQTQRGFGHSFDRPDADHLETDTTATSLSGSGANVSLGNYGSRFQFQVGGTYRSPGLELNDIGFLRNADEINQYFWAGYRWIQPFSIFRNLGVNLNEWSRWDFGGQALYQAININTFATFQNFWSTSFGINFEANDISNTWLRTGPAFRKPQGMGGFFNFSTDSRKKITQSFNTNGGGGYKGESAALSLGTTTNWQVTDGFNLSVGVQWNRSHREDQYVTTQAYDEEEQYIVGEILRKTLSFTIRANYNITPDLTIQYYGQPFLTRGIYTDFKTVENPLAQNINVRLKGYESEQISYTEGISTYFVDENIDGIIDYSFYNPNFNFVQFRSNLVARWEYIPGSEIFLVWSQGSSIFQNEVTGNLFNSLSDNLWNDSLVNTFLVKVTYRFTN